MGRVRIVKLQRAPRHSRSMESQAQPTFLPHPWIAPARCARCGRADRVIEGDGPAVCRVCLFAWAHYSSVILGGKGTLVREPGGIQLRHADHDVPMLACPRCRSGDVRSTPTFDGWMRGRNAGA